RWWDPTGVRAESPGFWLGSVSSGLGSLLTPSLQTVLTVKAALTLFGAARPGPLRALWVRGSTRSPTMARFTKLQVWQEARVLIRQVSALTRVMISEGDLVRQVRRAAISVASNLAEGSERGSDRDFLRFVRMANASCAEVEAQATIALDL